MSNDTSDIRISSATAMKEVLVALTAELERAAGRKVAIAYTTSGGHAKRVAGGEVADLIMVAQPDIEGLMQQGKLVPGSSVVLPLRNSMIAGISKIMSRVVLSCSVSPFTIVRMRRACGSGISSAVTRQGPSGAKVSKDFPRHHCPPPPSFCQSRALTSLAQV